MKEITELTGVDLAGKTAIARVDYNVPIQDGLVVDDLRIRSSFKTIEFLVSLGAKVVLISHLEGKGGTSLAPVAEHFHKKFTENSYKFDVNFISEYNFSEIKEKINSAPAGSVFLLENLRVNPGEKENSPEFAESLASLGDLYVGDAFPVAHREHASVIALPACFPDAHYAGFQIINEVKHLQEGVNPPHPFIFILGGAKFDTKLPLIQKIAAHADNIIIGGALFNDILKAKGLEVGKSLVSDSVVDLISIATDSRLVVSDDVVVENSLTKEKSIKSIGEISPDDSIMDIGPSIVVKFKEILEKAKSEGKTPFILWNGPMGNYEAGYKDSTIAIAKLLIDEKVKALLGGGDTSAAIAEGGLSHTIEEDPEIKNLIYLSTGGGAMIDYLINDTLPGIEALK